jgi:hypothetical protein
MIIWFEDRISAWSDTPTSIGLTTAQCTELVSRISAARVAYDAYRANYDAARASTPAYYAAADSLREYGLDLTHIIRSFANATNNANVYTEAMVPPPATPQAQGTPPTPQAFTGSIDNNGEVQLSWASPSGGYGSNVFFSVQRRFVDKDGVVGSWHSIGSTGDRRFVDNNVPTGNVAVAYRVAATRNSSSSTFTDPVEILFGNAPASVGSSFSEQPLALAA